MNFYKRHIGDYIKDTSHLSLLEHGIYTRLLDVYYTREQALPPFDQTARLIGARSDDERAALRDVLAEFFTESDAGYRQERCEREIEVAAAAAERSREVGKKGGRPRKDETQQVSAENPAGYFQKPTDNPSQTPDTRLQTPEKESRAPREVAARSPKGSRLSLQALPDEFRVFCEQNRPDLSAAATWDGFRDYWLAKAGRHALKVDWLATWRTWVRNQHAPQQARASPNRPQSAFDRNAEIIASLTGRQSQQSRKDIIDVTPPQPVPPRMGPAHLLPPDRHVRCAENGDDMGAD